MNSRNCTVIKMLCFFIHEVYYMYICTVCTPYIPQATIMKITLEALNWTVLFKSVSGLS